MEAPVLKVIHSREPSATSQYFFSEAIRLYNAGLKLHAQQTARLALRQARLESSNLLPDIYGFLAQIKEENGQYRLARSYCLQALKSLDKASPTYLEDYQYYHLLGFKLQQCN